MVAGTLYKGVDDGDTETEGHLERGLGLGIYLAETECNRKIQHGYLDVRKELRYSQEDQDILLRLHSNIHECNVLKPPRNEPSHNPHYTQLISRTHTPIFLICNNPLFRN